MLDADDPADNEISIEYRRASHSTSQIPTWGVDPDCHRRFHNWHAITVQLTRMKMEKRSLHGGSGLRPRRVFDRHAVGASRIGAGCGAPTGRRSDCAGQLEGSSLQGARNAARFAEKRPDGFAVPLSLKRPNRGNGRFVEGEGGQGRTRGHGEGGVEAGSLEREAGQLDVGVGRQGRRALRRRRAAAPGAPGAPGAPHGGVSQQERALPTPGTLQTLQTLQSIQSIGSIGSIQSVGSVGAQEALRAEVDVEEGAGRARGRGGAVQAVQGGVAAWLG